MRMGSGRWLVLLACAAFLPLAAEASCPSGEARVGAVTSAAKVERRSSLIDLAPGEDLCSGDLLVAVSEPVTYRLRCEGDETLDAGYRRPLADRKQAKKACTGVGWALFFFAEKRDAEARAVTLSPGAPEFGVAGLSSGKAVLKRMPKALVVPLDSVPSIPVSVVVTTPDGKTSWEKVLEAGSAQAVVFSGLPDTEGEWLIELRTGMDTLYGVFTVDRGAAKLKGKREAVLAAACGDLERDGFAALQALAAKGVSAEDLQLMSFWSDPASGSLCAPEPDA